MRNIFLSGERKTLVKRILDQTVHIPTREVYEKVLIEFEKFLELKIPYYVYRSIDQSSSSLKFNENFIKHINAESKFIEKEVNILIVDDAAYSGCFILSIMDTLIYDNPSVVFNFYLIVPYMLKHTQKYIEDTFDDFNKNSSKCKFFDYTVLPCIELTEKQIDLLGAETNILFTGYFSHKISNSFGSFPQIYLEGEINKDKKFGNLFEKDIIPSRKYIGLG